MAAEEPWFRGSVTINTVDIDDLGIIYNTTTSNAQDFLEVTPYYDQSNIPM